MKNKIYLPPLTYFAFRIILPSLLLLTLSDNVILSEAIQTTLEAKPFLTLEKPMLGFKISYPSDWNITDNDFVISFRAPNDTAVVTLSIVNSSSSKTNPITLEQYSSNEINTIKSVESKRIGSSFILLGSSQYLISGEPGHEIIFLNGTNTDTMHKYKTLLVWTVIDSKVYQIRYSAEVSEYSNYIQSVIYMIDSFELL